MVQEHLSIENLQKQIYELKIENIKLKDKIDNFEKKKKNYQNKENNFRCNVTLFKDNKKDYNKNINKIIYEIREYYDIYVFIIDPEFKNGNIDIDKVRNYVKENLLKKGKKYENNIRIEKEEGKYKNTGSNKRNHTNRIGRSVILYNKYGERLNNIYFSLSRMERIYEENWDYWLDYLENFMNNNKI
jgi:chromosome segregation ATPase